jgi:hypothetical protein
MELGLRDVVPLVVGLAHALKVMNAAFIFFEEAGVADVVFAGPMHDISKACLISKQKSNFLKGDLTPSTR